MFGFAPRCLLTCENGRKCPDSVVRVDLPCLFAGELPTHIEDGEIAAVLGARRQNTGASLRAANLALRNSLTPEEWGRAGVHAERGRESVRDLAAYSAGTRSQSFRAKRGHLARRLGLCAKTLEE
jgi:hypothetical protein